MARKIYIKSGWHDIRQLAYALLSIPRPALVGFRVLRGRRVHYFVYLDEFGHIGDFISRNHPRHNASPVFGLAGVALPQGAVRSFSMFFHKLKCNLLKWEIERSSVPASRWEKKGSSLYTFQNVTKYPELCHATFRLINKLKREQGFVFYSGVEKEPPSSAHTHEALYFSTLRDAIRRLDRFCYNNTATFSLLLDAVDSDEPGSRRKFRTESIYAACSEMFGTHHGHECRALLEPPYQLESHLFGNMQCADWFCGLLNRVLTFNILPDQYPDYEIFDKFFGERLKGVLKAQSLKKRSDSVTP